MIVTQIVYDVLTNKKHEEEIEVPAVEDMPNQEVQLSIEERLNEIEKVNILQNKLIDISLLATDEIYMIVEPLLESKSN